MLFCHSQPASPAVAPHRPFQTTTFICCSLCLTGVPFLPALWKFLPSVWLGSNLTPDPSKQTYQWSPLVPPHPFQPIWHSMGITECVYTLVLPFSWVLWGWPMCPLYLHSQMFDIEYILNKCWTTKRMSSNIVIFNCDNYICKVARLFPQTTRYLIKVKLCVCVCACMHKKTRMVTMNHSSRWSIFS